MPDPVHFREQAEQCRALAADADNGTAASLLMLAAEFEAEAERLEGKAKPHPGGMR